MFTASRANSSIRASIATNFAFIAVSSSFEFASINCNRAGDALATAMEGVAPYAYVSLLLELVFTGVMLALLLRVRVGGW